MLNTSNRCHAKLHRQELYPGFGSSRGTLLLLILLLFTACATVRLPETYPRTTSTALEPYQETTAGLIFEEAAAQHPGSTGTLR